MVYVPEQKEPVHRKVAFKVIKLGMDTKQVVARFEAEGQALAMMVHPNIAKVLDAGTTEGSAGWQLAVSPTRSRQTPHLERTTEGSNAPVRSTAPQAASPATQQTARLRYEPDVRAGRPFFVMELVRGIRITDSCDHGAHNRPAFGVIPRDLQADAQRG